MDEDNSSVFCAIGIEHTVQHYMHLDDVPMMSQRFLPHKITSHSPWDRLHRGAKESLFHQTLDSVEYLIQWHLSELGQVCNEPEGRARSLACFNNIAELPVDAVPRHDLQR